MEKEREMLTIVLHHLKEVNRRKLFSDLGYQSLFDYAVRELKYSEGAAGRRIQAMRLLSELPSLEVKIETGALSLSNLCQAQRYFKHQSILQKEDKERFLSTLENKSAREAEKIILSKTPASELPQERERIINPVYTEVRFIINGALKTKLEKVRSLLGIKGNQMTLAELLEFMADVTTNALEKKKFGSRRVNQEQEQKEDTTTAEPQKIDLKNPTSECNTPKKSRYIPQKLKHQIYRRDKNQCTICKGTRNLNIDHITPLALNGKTTAENLRFFG